MIEEKKNKGNALKESYLVFIVRIINTELADRRIYKL